MVRLYSTFAGGLPGVGLILMRLVVGSALVVPASSIMRSEPTSDTAAMLGLCAGCGILLLSGLWTPFAGVAVALIQLWRLVTQQPGDRWFALLLGSMAAALAMLGPGLWSVDARLFGWKRIESPPGKSKSS